MAVKEKALAAERKAARMAEATLHYSNTAKTSKTNRRESISREPPRSIIVTC